MPLSRRYLSEALMVSGAIIPMKAMTLFSSTICLTRAKCRFGSELESPTKSLIGWPLRPPLSLIHLTTNWLLAMPGPIEAPAGPLHSQIVPRLTVDPVAGPVGLAPPPGGAGTPGLGTLGAPWGDDEPPPDEPPDEAVPAADLGAGLVEPWDLGAEEGAPAVAGFGLADAAAPVPVAAGAVA